MSRKDLKAKPVSIYLPAELHALVKAQAENETRTFSQTIVHILTKYYEEQSQ